MYLGLDLGTSGVKAMLIDGDQKIIGSANGGLDVSHPKELAAVRGIGLSGQMHGATLLDADDKVLRPCILWNDTRSYQEAAALDADPRFRALTGNIVFPGFTAPK